MLLAYQVVVSTTTRLDCHLSIRPLDKLVGLVEWVLVYPRHPSMTPSKIEQGHGRVVLHNDGSGNVFSELAATYPLKLLAPRLPSQNISIVYMLSYGGGLVSGDRIHLEVEVYDAAYLAILSQVS